jgi:hypothetical protein
MMKTRSATVYQPAAPLRAVAVFLNDDGTHDAEDWPVVGVEATVRSDGEDTEVWHRVLVWHYGHGEITTAEPSNFDIGNGWLVVGPAAAGEEFWQRQIADAIKIIRGKLEFERSTELAKKLAKKIA